jgi:GTP cyclohydrolase I
VKFFAKQPQYQEKLVGEIADFFMQKVKPQGCMVIMEARHQCMACRGVESTGELITSAVRGSFLKDVNLKNEALRLLGVKE